MPIVIAPNSYPRGPARNPADAAALARWGVASGRIAAVDYATWVGWLSGAGKADYFAVLVGPVAVVGRP